MPLLAGLLSAAPAAALNLAQYPIYQAPARTPLLMLAMSKDHAVFYKAYDDYSDLDGDGIADTTYRNAYTYYGYFDAGKCYDYTSGVFEPAGLTGDHYCTGTLAGKWSGNFLNWAAMSRIDVIRKVLYGGLRSTDTTGSSASVVLERGYLPNDAHSWVKVYTGSDMNKLTPFSATTVSLCNTTVAPSTALSQTATTPPLLRVASGNYLLWAANERWQCRWRDEVDPGNNGNYPSGNTTGIVPGASAYTPYKSSNSLGLGDYTVRVHACVSAALLGGEKCKTYPNGERRPVGLLQDYGDSDSMYFGLMTGSYGANMSGGVLRKNVSSWRDEIDPNSGRFVSGGTPGIRTALDALRLYGYRHTDGTYYGSTDSDNCTFNLSSFTNGSCSNWGNPLSEIFLEALRYFSGASANSTFNVNDSTRFAGLGRASWQNVAAANVCSPLDLVYFNAGPSSYDSDELAGASDLGISDLAGETNAVASAEGISGSYFIGKTPGNGNGLCTPKTLSASGTDTFATATGTCPDAPRIGGSYRIAGLASRVHTRGLGSSGRKVDVFGVSLLPAQAQVTIPVPGSTKQVVLMPACQNASAGTACTIVEFRIIAQNLAAGTGKLYVNWESGEQGGDYDQDMPGTLDYVVTSNSLSVTTVVSAVSSGQKLGFGYIVSGTTQDGYHVHSGANSYTFTDPAGGLACGSGANCTNTTSSIVNAATTRSYTLGSATAARLNPPLYYAAKWGGFRDKNANGRPDAGEWEDHYFDVKNPGDLSPALSRLFATVASGDPSSAALSANVRTLQTSALLFQASYNPADWSGEVKAYGIDASTGLLSGLVWKASEHLPGAASRNIASWLPGSGGIAFQWANLSSAQKSLIGSSNTLDWLRGDQSREGTGSGSLRVRVNRLGDFVNSDPAFAGITDSGYGRLPGAEGTSYAAWVTAKESVPQMLYVGGNDGMLHGFDATSGVERLAYVPNAVYANLAALSITGYSHRYYVDGAPSVGDVYDGSRWRTLLLGTLGAGGKAVFGLDVSDASTFGPTRVLWEYTDTALGEGVRQALIVRTHDSAHPWIALFGNGYNSTGSGAVLYALDAVTGALVRKIALTATGENGLATPVAWDADGDLIADAVYAGDLLGNLWKFDFSGNASNWSVAFAGAPLFSARGPTGLAQPITVQPTVGKGKDGVTRVFFGTGKYLEASDGQVLSNPAVQSFYGLADTGSAITYVSRASVLTAQGIMAEYPAGTNGPYPLRVTSDNTPAGSARGWYLDLVPSSGVPAGERVVERAVIRYDRIVFPTMLPLAGSGCSGGGDGWILEVLATSGARPKTASFDLNGDGKFDGSDGVTLNGEVVVVTGINPQVGVISGAPAVVVGSKSETKWVTGSAGGTPFSVGERIDAHGTGRQSWIQLQ